MPVYAVNVITGREAALSRFINRQKPPGVKKAYSPLSIFNTPVFPGYIFIDMKFEASAYKAVLDIPGVICFLSPDFGIFPLSPEEKARLNEAQKDLKSPIGAAVRVVHGLYEGTIGEVCEIRYPRLYIKPQKFFYLEKPPLLNVAITHVVLCGPEAVLNPGTPVRIIHGERAGLKGIIKKIGGSHAVIAVSIFDREILIESHISNLEVCI